MSLTRWATVAGVPVHYARDLDPSLRNPGRPVTTWRSTAAFKTKLDALFTELWTLCPLGPADIIVSAGAFVDRNVANSNKKSAHASGKAFDVDGIIWHASPTRPALSLYAVDHASQPRIYWAVCAVANRHLRHVLHAAYNRPHRDHIHVEDTKPTAFARGSRAHVTFLQSALTHVHGVSVRIDGDFGRQTTAATAEVLERLGLPHSLDNTDTWRAFNLQTASIGLSVLTGGDDDPDRADDPDVEVAGQPEGGHERPRQPTGGERRLRLTRPRLRGADVRSAQLAFRAAGIETGPIDGIFGPLTRAATVAYQLRQGLVPDGVVGPLTAEVLGISLVGDG